MNESRRQREDTQWKKKQGSTNQMLIAKMQTLNRQQSEAEKERRQITADVMDTKKRLESVPNWIQKILFR